MDLWECVDDGKRWEEKEEEEEEAVMSHMAAETALRDLKNPEEKIDVTSAVCFIRQTNKSQNSTEMENKTSQMCFHPSLNIQCV